MKYYNRQRAYRYRLELALELILNRMTGNDAVTSSSGDLSREDAEAFEKILELIPEINAYKKSTAQHIRKTAMLKGFTGLREYSEYLYRDSKERQYLHDNLTLKGTSFFRGDEWNDFEKYCLSALKSRKTVKSWCAGCSSGEEVYSLAMAMAVHIPETSFSVLATDYDEAMLALCELGTYPKRRLKEIPVRYRKYVTKTIGEIGISKELKSKIMIKKLDLLKDEYPKGFDLILCRNVIKFFSPEIRPSVQSKLAASLNAGGYLFLSADGNHNTHEIIGDPDKMHLTRINGKSIYQKV